jgi:hypothetical protein
MNAFLDVDVFAVESQRDLREISESFGRLNSGSLLEFLVFFLRLEYDSLSSKGIHAC